MFIYIGAEKVKAILIGWVLVTLMITVPVASLTVAFNKEFRARPIALSLFAGSAIATLLVIYSND